MSTLFAFALFAADEAAKKTEPSMGEMLRGLLVPLALIGVMFYFMFVLPQRREKRLRDEMYSKLKKNDRVITNAGIIATVANIKDEEVTLLARYHTEDTVPRGGSLVGR